MDAQELLLNEAEVQKLSRVWDDASSFSDFMDTLRISPSVMSGKSSTPENPKSSILCIVNCYKARK